ncbi:MAG: zf-HC2 domain-containing protein [Deltaproteobacteria bacterium]|nr:zf-HC2 domain-containing protein [Deltaproteobacteria bacterium]
MKLSCREIFENLSAYIDAELDPSLCDEIEKHMEGCNPCVAFLNTLKKTVVLYKYSGKEQEIPQEVHFDLHRFLRRECAQDDPEKR